ncbi:Pre-mRNA-splicing factor cwc24 [Escovopsis weberi]|uniref:Pre-mRNA-splicing factor CWC24 n=1 Tax=Escovopsis weberi TaxID=150374 RepID=A0A0M8MZA8_ESCWE|nr:Pre-mRNA-splicing factor cwc24 [Escovopsis weberi]
MEDSEASTAPVAIFKRRGAKGKANLRKRPATPPPADSDSDSAYSSSEDESGQRVKRRKTKAVVTATSKGGAPGGHEPSGAAAHAADRSVPIASSNDATKQSNWYDEDAKDALSAKSLLGSTRSRAQATDAGDQPDGTYKGLANKTSFIQRNPDAPRKTVGPIKAPTNIRTITITDYAPDVCKDYRITGFCGFGDNCKYLHSREDYKAGWQLDREWENVTKGKQNLGGTVMASANRDSRTGDADGDDDDDEDAMLENIPFACIICQESYKEPVITRCGHYFCLPCALKRYKKDPTCAACGSGTNGVFNSASKLKKLLARKRERISKRRQEAIERGEEVSDEDDGGEEGES